MGDMRHCDVYHLLARNNPFSNTGLCHADRKAHRLDEKINICGLDGLGYRFSHFCRHVAWQLRLIIDGGETSFTLNTHCLGVYIQDILYVGHFSSQIKFMANKANPVDAKKRRG